MSTTLVAFDGFPLIGTSALGGKFTLQGLDGWLASSLRRERQDKAQQDGAWASTGYLGSLPITVRGQAVYADDVSAATERRRMQALGGRGTSELTVIDSLGTGTRLVEKDSLVVSPVRGGMFVYSLTVTACDPLLYGAPAFGQTSLASIAGGAGRVWPRVWPTDWGIPPGVTPGAITLANAGTASYFPRLRIDGPVTNPVVTLVETGDSLRFNGVIAAGQHLDINWGVPRRVTIGDNPVPMRHKMTVIGNFLAVPVGGGSISYSADDADPAALLSIWSYEGVWE